MHQKKMQQEAPRQSLHDQHSFQPVVNDLVTREQFERKQIQFQKTLDKKKAMKQTTQPRSPKFTQTASRGVKRDYMNEPTRENFCQGKARTKAVPKPDNSVNPATTKATQLAMQKRRQEIQNKLHTEEQGREEDQKRRHRQMQLKGVVQATFRKENQDKDEEIKKQVQEKKAAMLKSCKDTKRGLRETVKKGREQPLLVDRCKYFHFSQHE